MCGVSHHQSDVVPLVVLPGVGDSCCYGLFREFFSPALAAFAVGAAPSSVEILKLPCDENVGVRVDASGEMRSVEEWEVGTLRIQD